MQQQLDPTVELPEQPHLEGCLLESVHILPHMPVVMSFNMLNPAQLSAAQSLQDMATELGAQGFPLCRSNWRMISQDDRVLGDFRIEFQPYQPRNLPHLHRRVNASRDTGHAWHTYRQYQIVGCCYIYDYQKHAESAPFLHTPFPTPSTPLIPFTPNQYVGKATIC